MPARHNVPVHGFSAEVRPSAIPRRVKTSERAACLGHDIARIPVTAQGSEPIQMAHDSRVPGVIQRLRPRTQRTAARNQVGPTSRSGRPLVPTHRYDLSISSHNLKRLFVRAERERQQQRLLRGLPKQKLGLSKIHYVYVGTSKGKVAYVGITNDARARQVEHGPRFKIHVLNPREAFSRIEARAIEQYLIEQNRNNIRNQNIANSISSRHNYYDAAMRFGESFVEWAEWAHGRPLR